MLRVALAVSVLLAASVTARASEPPLPRPLLERALETADCSLTYDEAAQDLAPLEDLGGGLRLFEFACWRGAYNMGSIFFALDPAAPSRARLLEFRVWNGKAFVQQHSLGNPSYDAKRRKLDMHIKGRGLGDCGSAGLWQWSGNDFVLEAFWHKEKCDGRPFNPTDKDRWQVYPPRHR